MKPGAFPSRAVGTVVVALGLLLLLLMWDLALFAKPCMPADSVDALHRCEETRRAAQTRVPWELAGLILGGAILGVRGEMSRLWGRIMMLRDGVRFSPAAAGALFGLALVGFGIVAVFFFQDLMVATANARAAPSRCFCVGSRRRRHKPDCPGRSSVSSSLGRRSAQLALCVASRKGKGP